MLGHENQNFQDLPYFHNMVSSYFSMTNLSIQRDWIKWNPGAKIIYNAQCCERRRSKYSLTLQLRHTSPPVPETTRVVSGVLKGKCRSWSKPGYRTDQTGTLPTLTHDCCRWAELHDTGKSFGTAVRHCDSSASEMVESSHKQHFRAGRSERGFEMWSLTGSG